MSSQSIDGLISIISLFAKKINDDLFDLNGAKLVTIGDSLASTLLEEFRQVELSNEALSQLQSIENELNNVYSQFITTDPHDKDSYNTVHQQLYLIIQKIVGILDDNIATIDGSLSTLKQVSVKQKIVDLTLEELGNL